MVDAEGGPPGQQILKKSKITLFKEDMGVWVSEIWGKLTGWIPSWEDISQKWTDMSQKVTDWEADMNQWFSDMWDKMTGWIPSIEDIKGAAGDFKEWVKQIATDIKLWFWDSSKPQLIGIDLGAIAKALPSIGEIKDNIISSLPKWMRPDTIAEQIADKKAEIKEHKDMLATGDTKTATFKDRQKIVTRLEGEVADLEREYGVDIGAPTTITPSISVGGANLSAAMKDSATGKFSGVGPQPVLIDNKKVNSGNMTQTQTNIIDPGTQDMDPVTSTVTPRYGRMALYQGG
tara:strand:- start:45 stop:911 length:867 start_codon:yes stop_codon:yes gene_type:complete